MADSIPDQIDEFFSKYPKRSYPKGQILVFADETPSSIFYLTKGRVREYDVSYRGDEIIVNIFKPPAFFPMSVAINSTHNKYFYKTEEETELHLVPASEAVGFLKANPDVLMDLLSRVYRGIDGMLGRLVQLMSGSAKSRLLYELLIEARRFGQEIEAGVIRLNLTESDLAARAGMSRETVSREMRQIKAAGIVGLANGSIIIKNLKLLKKKVESED